MPSSTILEVWLFCEEMLRLEKNESLRTVALNSKLKYFPWFWQRRFAQSALSTQILFAQFLLTGTVTCVQHHCLYLPYKNCNCSFGVKNLCTAVFFFFVS